MFRKRIAVIKIRSLLPVLFLLICIVLPVISSAQDDAPSSSTPIDPNDVPIDGGLSLLLAAGTAYGIKKYRNHKVRKKKNLCKNKTGITCIK